MAKGDDDDEHTGLDFPRLKDTFQDDDEDEDDDDDSEGGRRRRRCRCKGGCRYAKSREAGAREDSKARGSKGPAKLKAARDTKIKAARIAEAMRIAEEEAEVARIAEEAGGRVAARIAEVEGSEDCGRRSSNGGEFEGRD